MTYDDTLHSSSNCLDDRVTDQPGSVAIVHDYLTQKGGAERVVLAMHRAFPNAPIYTSLYESDATYPEFRNMDIRPSYLNGAGFLRKQHRLSLPLLAHAFSRMQITEKVVLCSSSGWAHGVHTSGTKLVYCYCPARWLYKGEDYFRKGASSPTENQNSGPSLGEIHTSALSRTSLRLIAPFLRRWDRKAAASANEYFTTSSIVAGEIERLYSIQPLVIPPPPLCTEDGATEEPDIPVHAPFFLIVSRLLPYKNLDRIFEVFAKRRDLNLVVVGSGPLEKSLRQSATDNIELAGNVNDRQLRWLYGNCRALIAPAFEDYGLTPLEAASFGKPTIALRGGGYLDTIAEGTSGYFFPNLELDLILDAINELEEHPLDDEEIRKHASLYSEEHFLNELRRHVASHLS